MASTTAQAQTTTIVGFGDSLMAGYLLEPQDSFPAKLEQALKEKGYDVTVINAGVSGDTTTGGLARLDWSIPDGTALVVLELGANDMLRGLPPETIRKNLDQMLARLKERNIQVVLAGMMAAPNLGPDYGERFNAIFPELAKHYQNQLIPFFLEDVTGDSKYLLEDGMHPNPEGVDIMIRNSLPPIETALEKLSRS